ncbi:PREDICTED: transmembrane protein 140 [Elephantulus edwardii]|uniref:transmembrane protein 140 n=1 Tax=Elephantulus edwardii TaxID=28737 RepID=UPI0003F0CA39|nr:PREDICTED: transmembrane protein 140 [Elephantulus edwardii]
MTTNLKPEGSSQMGKVLLTACNVGGVIALFLYILVWKAGDLTDLEDLRIGFYNLCLWNQSAGGLQCFQATELQALGVSWLSLALARLLVYGAMLLTIFALLPLFLSPRIGNERGWQLSMVLIAVSSMLLPVGLGLFLCSVRRWLQPVLLGSGFLTLATIQVILMFLLLAMVAFPPQPSKGQQQPSIC